MFRTLQDQKSENEIGTESPRRTSASAITSKLVEVLEKRQKTFGNEFPRGPLSVAGADFQPGDKDATERRGLVNLSDQKGEFKAIREEMEGRDCPHVSYDDQAITVRFDVRCVEL